MNISVLYDITTLASIHCAGVSPGGIVQHVERLGRALSEVNNVTMHVGVRAGQEAKAKRYIEETGKFLGHDRALDVVGFEKQAEKVAANIVHINWRGCDALPKIRGCKIVYTLPDIIAIKSPGYFAAENQKNAARDYTVDLLMSVDDGHTLCVAAKKTKSDILNRFGHINSQQITVLPLGHEVAIQEITGKSSKLAENLKKNDAFKVLCVNTIEPRKNMRLVLDAVRWIYEREPSINIEVFIVGAQGWLTEAFEAQFNELPENLKCRIHRTGFVSDSDLQTLRENCDVFVFPSYDEGFGLPIMEAMAAGMPVITSVAAACVETAGGLSYPINGNSSRALAEQLLKIRNNEPEVKVRTAAALRFAELRNWNWTAGQLHSIYADLLGINL
jgi:glycosyltransferase involved in cell wall biosynthesis